MCYTPKPMLRGKFTDLNASISREKKINYFSFALKKLETEKQSISKIRRKK